MNDLTRRISTLDTDLQQAQQQQQESQLSLMREKSAASNRVVDIEQRVTELTRHNITLQVCFSLCVSVSVSLSRQYFPFFFLFVSFFFQSYFLFEHSNTFLNNKLFTQLSHLLMLMLTYVVVICCLLFDVVSGRDITLVFWFAIHSKFLWTEANGTINGTHSVTAADR